MDRFRTLQTFVAVADHASFARAARQLRLSPTTVTRTIAALERDLGVPLLARTTRTVRLTEEGELFLQRCRTALAEIDDAYRLARGQRATPSGRLTVTAPVTFGLIHVVPIVTDLMRRHPDLGVRLLLLDRVTNLVAEGIDVAVRIGEVEDSALQMLRIARVRRVFSASPDYLGLHGVPTRARELREHRLIDVEDELGNRAGQPFSQKGRIRLQQGRLTVNNVNAAIAAAVAGLGVVGTLSYQVAAHIRAGQLVEVLTEEDAAPVPVALLFQRGRRDSPNVRAFVELARSRLGGEL